MANFSPSELCGFEHRFGHELGMKLKSQHTIKAQSLEATLLAIILIRDVFCVSMPEQDTTKMGRVYENITRYTRILLFCYVQDVQRVRVRRYLGQYNFCKGVRNRSLSVLGSALLV